MARKKVRRKDAMGLSASQARLLSITARLGNNELHSQQIANSKVRLADQTQKASQEYIQALDSTKLMYTTYDANGAATQVGLTGSLLYTYEPMKSQYTLQDASGINYVSHTDAENYETTGNLYEFLDCYGLIDNYEEFQTELDAYDTAMQAYEGEMATYETDYAKYLTDMQTYRTNMVQYNLDMAQYAIDYQIYLDSLNAPDVYAIFSGFVGTSSSPNMQAGQCYANALSGQTSCYKHLLAHILDYGGGNNFSTQSYTASNGRSTSLISTSGWMTDDVQGEAEWLKIVEAINDPNRKCDGDDKYTGPSDTDKYNSLKSIIASGRRPTDVEILLSDYVYDSTTNTATEVKTLRQKTIDLLYLLNNSSTITLPSGITWKDTLINFTDGDMRKLTLEEPPMPELPTKPEMPNPPAKPVKPSLKVLVNDQEKGQWYINMWYMMNGSDSANLLREDGDDSKDGFFVVETEGKSENTAKAYKVLDDQLLNSADWLKFALEQGIVTINKAQYYNPGTTEGTAEDVLSERITWASTTYGSMSEVSEVEDQVAIARAEAEYTKKLNEIESKDKQYDIDIKKLDTEHNALQTEYESIQNVIQKNVDRSFKAFS